MSRSVLIYNEMYLAHAVRLVGFAFGRSLHRCRLVQERSWRARLRQGTERRNPGLGWPRVAVDVAGLGALVHEVVSLHSLDDLDVVGQVVGQNVPCRFVRERRRQKGGRPAARGPDSGGLEIGDCVQADGSVVHGSRAGVAYRVHVDGRDNIRRLAAGLQCGHVTVRNRRVSSARKLTQYLSMFYGWRATGVNGVRWGARKRVSWTSHSRERVGRSLVA